MNYIVEENEIYILDSNEKKIAQITYERIKDNVYNINHTFVEESWRGQRIAKKLVEMAIAEIKKKKARVWATCSYAKKYIENNL